MEGRRGWLLALTFLLMVIPRGEALELYGRSTAIIRNGELTFIDATGDDLSDDRIITSIRYPTVISAGELRRLIDDILQESFVFIGGSIKCIPETYAQSRDMDFLLSLLTFLDEKLIGHGRIEVIPDLETGGGNWGGVPYLSGDHVVEFVLVPGSVADYRVLYRRGTDATYSRFPATVKTHGVSNPFQNAIREVDSEQPVHFDTEVADVADKIETGVRVNVILTNGAIQVTFFGTIIGSGKGDDTVRVKIDQTGRELEGIVLGPSEVQVAF